MSISGDIQHLVNTLTSVLNPNNDIRLAAEADLKKVRTVVSHSCYPPQWHQIVLIRIFFVIPSSNLLLAFCHAW